MAHHDFLPGWIVKWADQIWIVSDYDDDQGILTLIDSEHPNCMAYPSRTWPDDRKKRLGSVIWLADSMHDFIIKRIRQIF